MGGGQREGQPARQGAYASVRDREPAGGLLRLELRPVRLGRGMGDEARAYKQRATAEEVARRRQQPRRRRLGPTAASTELGKRMRDDMSEVARIGAGDSDENDLARVV